MRKLLALVGSLFVAGALAQEYPVEHFFQNPRFTSMQLSPDGMHVAALAPVNGHRNVVVVRLQDREARAATNLDDIDVAGFFWATSDRLVFTVDSDGNESFGLYAVDSDGTRARALIEPAPGIALVQRTAEVIDRLENDPDHVLITYNDRNLFYPDVYELDIQNGAMRRVTIPPGNPQFWMADHEGVVRIVGVEGDRPRDLITRIMYRADEQSEWNELASRYYFDPGWSPLDFTADNRHLYVASNLESDTTGVYLYDPETNTMGEKLFAVEGYDVGDITLSRTGHDLISINYVDTLPRRHLVDPEWRDIYEAIDTALPDTLNLITSMTDDEQRMIVAALSDRDPGTYYFFDREANALEFFAQRMPWIDPETMAEMRPIFYAARDGERINGYLTLPPDRRSGEAVPLIVHPHGGPYGIRDTWRFNEAVQFLANRGYAVLQMNFRGSGGYGRRFQHIGYQKFGLEMQHDITDGVQWAIAEGIADPERICIFGASYGGYASMAGVTFTPEFYQCAINYVGLVDLEMWYRWLRPFEFAEAWFSQAIGDPVQDAERFAATSPLNHVDKIRVPVLVVHGERDPRVEIDQARRLLRAFRQEDIEHGVLIKRDEGHGFRKEENNLELYRLIDEFLEQHL